MAAIIEPTRDRMGRELMDLLREFNDVFALDPMEVGRTDLVQHHWRTCSSKAATKEDTFLNENTSRSYGG